MYPVQLLNKLRESSGFIAKNSLSVSLRLLAIAFVFFPQRWLNENLSSEVFAQVNVSLSVIGVVMGILTLGVPQLLHRVYTHMAHTPERDMIWSSLAGLRVVSFVPGLVLVALASLFGWADLEVLILLYVPAFLFLTDVAFRSIVDSDNRSWQYSFTDLCSKAVLNLGLFWAAVQVPVVSQWPDFYKYAFALFLSAVTAVGLDLLLQRKHYRFVRPSVAYLRRVRPTIVYLGMTGFLVGAFLTTDKIFLESYGAGDNAINGYSNAYKLFEVAVVVPGITMPVLASTVIKRIRGSAAGEQRVTLRRYLMTTLGVGFGVALGFAALGPWVLSLIDPAGNYIQISRVALWTLTPAVILNFGVTFLAHMFVLSGHDKQEMKVQTRNLLFALLTYGVLIYFFSYVGAAVSTILIYLFDLVQRYYMFFAAREKLELQWEE